MFCCLTSVAALIRGFVLNYVRTVSSQKAMYAAWELLVRFPVIAFLRT